MPLIIVIPAAILLFALIGIAINNRAKSGILVSLFMLLFFSFGHVWKVLGIDELCVLGRCPDAMEVTAIIFAIIMLTGFALLMIYKGDLVKFTFFLNIFAVVLISFQLIMAAYSLVCRSQRQNKPTESHLTIYDTGLMPDIYYIILDGYAAENMLREKYNFDNHDFLDYLDEKGFFIAENSYSNYCQTVLSITSILNLDYLTIDNSLLANAGDSRVCLCENLWDNRVIRLLSRQAGYSSVSFASGYSLLEQGRFDAFISAGISLNEYHHELLNSTPIFLLFRSMQPQYKIHHNRILFTFGKIHDITEVDPPMFVYAHVVAPHPPFIFDSAGGYVKQNRPFNMGDGSHYFATGACLKDYLEGYIGNLCTINTLAKTAIDNLLAEGDRPIIIILQGDHGPGSGLDWYSLEKTDVTERFSILNAFYFYDRDYSMLYPEISPVNTFRIIFNQYFDADYELLEDRHYYSTHDRPFEFTEISDRLKKN